MDALEFLREHKRMCNHYEGCCDCPLEVSICPGISTVPDEDYKKLITVVEHWSAAHPKKTRQDVFLEQWPEAVLTEDGVISICPITVSAAYRNKTGGCASPTRPQCDVCCREFWSKVVR